MSNKIARPALALALSCLTLVQPYSALADPKSRPRDEARRQERSVDAHQGFAYECKHIE
jgi:hypothetical protein